MGGGPTMAGAASPFRALTACDDESARNVSEDGTARDPDDIDCTSVAEAGGCVEVQNADDMIRDGGRVVVGTPAVFDRLLELSKTAFGQTD